ncbi:MAG TPA: hypothetical protein VFE07_13990 [Marmoricola sp.]|nr:hypothetical protein [Marmoricola sp.]
MRAPVVVLAGWLVALACLAGCGSDSPADTFRTQADAVCKDGNDAIDEVSKDFGPDGPTPEQLAVAAPKVPQLMTHELDRLAALDVPPELADDVASMLATFRAVVATMRQQGTAFFERKDQPFAAAYAKAKALGLDECAH